MSRYVDEQRGRFGVEPICTTLGVSVSAYYQRRSGRRSDRAVEDEGGDHSMLLLKARGSLGLIN